jgi:hypothetical protein
MLVARVISIPDDLVLRDLHELFLAVLRGDYEPDFIIRICTIIRQLPTPFARHKSAGLPAAPGRRNSSISAIPWMGGSVNFGRWILKKPPPRT